MWLENEHIRLRALEPEDLEILYQWENNTQLWKYGSTLTPFSRLTLRQYLIDSQQQDLYQMRQLRLMIELKAENLVIGSVDLFEYDPHNNRAGIGILIDDAYQRKNYATEALQLVEKYAFDFLDIHQLFAYIAVENEKSYGLFQKLGYNLVGTLKDWRRHKDKYQDVYLMQLVRDGKSE